MQAYLPFLLSLEAADLQFLANQLRADLSDLDLSCSDDRQVAVHRIAIPCQAATPSYLNTLV